MRVIVMGVTGCGKSSVGAALAAEMGYEFADADDFHPPASVAAMAQGIPLADEDRWPWLDAVGAWMKPRADVVVACSALRRAHRNRLVETAGPAMFLHLAAPQAVIEERVRQRSARDEHFAGVELLAAQYALLEPLGLDEVGGGKSTCHTSASARWCWRPPTSSPERTTRRSASAQAPKPTRRFDSSPMST